MSSPHLSFVLEKIAAAQRTADALVKQVDHCGLQGQIREIALRECVEPFLTQSYSCATGKVIDSRRSISDQIDLVVFHRKVAPPILINRDLGLFPVECVRYVFEVKSTLTAEEVRDANKKFRSVANLVSFPSNRADGRVLSGPRPTTVLFAFASDIEGCELERYLRHSRDEFPPSTVLCVLGKCYWFFDKELKCWRGGSVKGGLEMRYLEFAAFIGGFMNTLAAEETSMRPFHPAAYVAANSFPWGVYVPPAV